MKMSETSHNTIDLSKLNAYIDGELDATQCEEVEAYIHSQPDAAAYVESVKQQNNAFRNEFDSVLDEDVPDFLMQTLELDSETNAKAQANTEAQVQAQTTVLFPTYRIAASIFLFALGGLMGWFIKPMTDNASSVYLVDQGRFVEQARLAHVMYTPEKLHPVDVTADNEKHLIAWVSKRLGVDIKAPELTELGFHLVGGRLLPSEMGPSAQFMYESQQGKRLTLYVNKNSGKDETAFEYFEDQGVASFYWVDKSLVYALTGGIERAKLLSVSHVVYNHFNQPSI